MRIKQFKLLSRGEEGIQVHAKEFIAGEKYQVIDDVQRTRKLSVDKPLVEEVQKLKYFFLNLTGHWIEPYSNHYDSVEKKVLYVKGEAKSSHVILKDLWNRTFVTGATAGDNGSFVITGEIEITPEKKIGLATPLIHQEDDFGFHADCLKTLNDISVKISEYFASGTALVERKIKELPSKPGMTEEEVADEELSRMVRNNIIAPMEGISADEGDEQSDTGQPALNESTKNIDGKHLKEAGIEEPDFEPKKPDPYGPPAATIPADTTGEVPTPAEQKATDPGDLSSMEHSESMGISEQDEKEGDEEEW